MLPGRGRGTKTGLADTGSKEKALAEKIMQELAKENLTISQVSTVLVLAQDMIQTAKFTDFAKSGGCAGIRLVSCKECHANFIPEGNLCPNCGAKVNTES